MAIPKAHGNHRIRIYFSGLRVEICGNTIRHSMFHVFYR